MAVKMFSYRRGQTPLHRFPAVLKIVFMMFFCVFIFSGTNGASKETLEEILKFNVLVHLGICFAVNILLFVLGKGNASSIGQMKWVIWFGLLVTVFRLIPENYADFKDWNLYRKVLTDGIAAGTLYTLKFFSASFACQMIFETTSNLEIRESFEKVHRGICKILPFMKKFNLAFVISLAVTFIPEVFASWEKVRLACKARQGKKRRFFQNLLAELMALLSVLIGLAETKRKAILNRGFQV